MSISKLQAWADNEANELIKKYDRNGDGVLSKEELQSLLLHSAQGSTRLNNQEFVPEIPKTNNEVANKLKYSHTYLKPEKQLRDKVQNPATKILDGKPSNASFSREQIKEVLKYHDSDKDGFLNVKEVAKALGFLGSIVPFHKAHYALVYADADKDNRISVAELDKLIDYVNKVTGKK